MKKTKKREMNESETKRTLRAMTWGYQDLAIANTSSPSNYIRVVKHETFSLGGRDGNQVKHLINQCRSGYGIANIRINGSAWRDAKLYTTAPQVISTVPFPKHGNSFFLTDGGNYLPFVAFHGFEISFTNVGNEVVNLTYDIVECAPYTGYFAIVFRSYAFGGTAHLSMGCKKVQLSFENPVEKILLHFEKEIHNIPLFFCKIADKDFTLNFKNVSETDFVLDFENDLINFQHLASAEVLVDTSEENSVEICSITHNILRSASHMYGLAFTPSFT